MVGLKLNLEYFYPLKNQLYSVKVLEFQSVSDLTLKIFFDSLPEYLHKILRQIWKSDLEFVSELDTPGGILSMCACDQILYTCSSDGIIRSWDLNTAQNSATITSTLFQPQKLFVDKAASVLWAGDSEGNVAKFENGREIAKLELAEEIWDLMTFNNLVYTGRDRDIVVAEVSFANNKARGIVKATIQGRSPFCIAGSHFCFLNREGRNILVHENDVGKKFPRLNEIVASELIINALATADDETICSAGYDGIVKLWNIKNSTCLGSVNLGCCVNYLACKSKNEVYVARSDGIVTKIGA